MLFSKQSVKIFIKYPLCGQHCIRQEGEYGRILRDAFELLRS